MIITFIVLKIICLAKPNTFRFLYISSGKSATNARLLGGLSISLSFISSIAFLLYQHPTQLSLSEKSTLLSALASILLVTLYGYVDDRFEVRVRLKLSLQLTSVLSFSLLNAHNILPNHQGATFLISSIVGLALINGTNLLDGLDTLSVKLGICASIAFIYLGIISNSNATVFLSIILISALTVFYFFNREPAKIYMGEIGGSIIGLIFYIQSSLCISMLNSRFAVSKALPLVLIAGYLPICELGISFLRRIISKKSPFRGDKLHLHYIIKSKYHLSASQTSSLMAISSFTILCFGFIISSYFNPLMALVSVLLLTILSYLWICLREWKLNIKPENVQNSYILFEGKKVTIINSTPFNLVNISVKETADINHKQQSA